MPTIKIWGVVSFTLEPLASVLYFLTTGWVLWSCYAQHKLGLTEHAWWLWHRGMDTGETSLKQRYATRPVL